MCVTQHNDDLPTLDIPVGTTLEETERRLLVATLEHFDGNKTKAAESLGVSLKTVYNMMERHGLRREVLTKAMRDV